jgi:hypothetical protein
MACFQHSMVLYLRGYDVIPLVTSCVSHAFNRRIIAFRAPAGKNNLFLPGADKLRNDVPTLLYGILGLLAEGMETRGIPVHLRKEGQHGLYDSCIRWGRRCIIQINFFHCKSSPDDPNRPCRFFS